MPHFLQPFRPAHPARRRPRPDRLFRLLRSAVAWLVVAWVMTSSSPAAAQSANGDGDDTDEADRSKKLERPKLREFAEAPYPEEALDAGVEGTVVLILKIDADGHVTDTRVEEGPGHGLNEAAAKAARKFVFRPAHRGETPVASRIRYRYEFELPETHERKESPSSQGTASSEENSPEEGDSPRERPPSKGDGDDTSPDSDTTSGTEATSDADETGGLRGVVRRPSGDAPAADAAVRLTGPDDSTRELRTGDDGTFDLDSLPPGRYRIEARTSSGAEATAQTDILPGGTAEVALRLQTTETSDRDRALEVTVRGESDEERIERSARSVDVIDTERAAAKADDTGEVVAGESGVNVRRTGGLGSGTRFSLNGLDDNQIRFFLDGVPLEFAGFPFGIANVPVNLVDRIDVYKGVVPVRYGADALGGAVDLATEKAPAEPGLGASYQVGSFDTHRLTLNGELAGDDSPMYVRSNAFFDYSKNDYPVDVEVADRSGNTYDVTTRRFHDDYRAAGGALEVGAVDVGWADEVSARIFLSDFARDLQHNLVMTVPYGEARYGQTAGGGLLRFDREFGGDFRLDLAAGYNLTRTWFEDLATCNYDWFGRCTSQREQAGEIGRFPSDHRIWEHAGFGRFNASWQPFEGQTLRLSVAPTYVTRTGEERADTPRTERDPLAAKRDLVDVVSGLEYETDLLDGRLQNIGFFKDYLQLARTEETVPSGDLVERNRNTHRLGVGDSLRYDFNDWFRGKLAYEWATRLPSPDEIFGNGVRIQPNPTVQPERSHNANVEFDVHDLETPTGTWRTSATGFLRQTDDLIVLIGGNRSFSYQNVLRARSAGVEASTGWTSPGRHVAVDLNGTYVDLRNVSDDGAFADFRGDRIPNRPYLFANGNLRLRETDLFVEGDSLTFSWDSRYVHEYFRGWGSLGDEEFKLEIPSQWLQSPALTYAVEGADRTLSTTLEIQNLTDAEVFDFFGVQQPGRAVYIKSTIEL